MLIRSTRLALSTALVLALVMTATRGHVPWQPLPDASWAVFFLLGLCLKPAWVIAPFVVLATLIDWAAVQFAGVSSFCITGAYAMLLPTYLALWGAGRWLALGQPVAATTAAPSGSASWRTWLAPVSASRWAVAVVAGSVVAELLSSGGFYFLGVRFTEPSVMAFLAREVRYFPPMLLAMLLYSSLGIVALRRVQTLTRVAP